MRSSVAARLGLVLFGLLAALLLVEILLRVLGSVLLPSNLRLALAVADTVAQQQTLYQQDAELGQVLQPDLDTAISLSGDFSYRLRTSDLGLGGVGFRDRDVQPPVYAVALGDSFTFGLGVDEEDSWVARLQETLGKEVVNLGQPGFGPVQEERMVQRYVRPLRPQVVLWMVFPNDLEDGLLFNGMGGVAERPTGRLDRLLGALRPFSRLALLIEFSLGRGPLVWAEGYERRTVGDDGAGGGRVARPRPNEIFFHPDLLARQINLTDPTIDTGWWITRNAIASAAAEVQADGSELILVLAPPRERAYLNLLSADPAVPYNTDELFGRFKALGDELGIRVLDLTPAFIQAAQDGDILYFQHDGHWNEAGNALAASAIADFLNPD